MQRIGLVVVPGFQALSFSAFSVFEIANWVLGKPRYALTVMAEGGLPVTTSFGMEASPQPLDFSGIDTLLVGASMRVEKPSRTLKAFLQGAAKSTRRVGSLCIGAFALGYAGLLDERHATTHWQFTEQMQRTFPRVKLASDRVFTEDGGIWTSAGMTAGIDMALGMVERDLGAVVARETAKALVMERRRIGGVSQHSVLLELEPKSDAIQEVLEYARSHLVSPLTVEELARVACLSPRQFARLFRSETGQTPAKAVEGLRLEAARLLAEQSATPMEEIAAQTGFGTRERMRRAFVRLVGEAPQALRSRQRMRAVSPAATERPRRTTGQRRSA